MFRVKNSNESLTNKQMFIWEKQICERRIYIRDLYIDFTNNTI